MRESVLEIIRCPKCAAERPFMLHPDQADSREVRDGRLACGVCGSEFQIRAGVIDLLPPQVRKEVSDEVQGWDDAHFAWFDMTGTKSNFWLVEPDNRETEGISSDEFIRRLPDWERIGKSFAQNEKYKVDTLRELLDSVEIKPGLRLLEIGAARCWTVRDFTKMGCRCVATDITTTKYVGLETSDVYFEENPSLYWERIRCDMEELPFAAASFDIVFCNAVLHHSKSVPKIISEIWRVLAPGGRVLIVNEPDYGLLDYAKCKRAQEAETASGANENLYNRRYFVNALRAQGFQTKFPPCMWLIKYYAWTLSLKLDRLRIDRSRLMRWIEKLILVFETPIRWFIALGTVGVATKPEK